MSTDVNSEKPGAGTAPASSPLVALRHVAGLTAGQTLPLDAGHFRFGPRRSSHGGLVAGTPDAVSFDLTIHDDGETVLSAGEEAVAVEGVIIQRPVALDDGDVVQLATDHFLVETRQRDGTVAPTGAIEPRSVAPLAPTKMRGWLLLFAAVAVIGVVLSFSNGRLIGIALLGLAGIIGTLLLQLRRNDQAREAHSIAIDNARLMLFAEVVERRKAAAEALRSVALTPAAIAERAATPSAASPAHVSATIASGDQPWEPPVEIRRSLGWDHRSVVDDLSFLPAIPYSVDLDDGPLAIIGPRSATLAVARHLVTTVMFLAGPGTGADVETAVPADWGWLRSQPNSGLRVLDHVSGAVGPRTLVLQPSIDALVAAGFDETDFGHVLEINEAGTANLTTADGTGTGFVPHGITETHARELEDLLARPLRPAAVPSIGPSVDAADSPSVDLTIFDTDRLLVTGPDHTRHRGVLATAALRQTDRHPDRSLYILDRGDRALIRLSQLDSCVRYTTIDQIEAVEQMVDELDALTDVPAVPFGLVLAPDLWNTVDFYRDTGHDGLADRIDDLIAKMEVVPMAASTSTATPAATSSFLVWIETGDGETADIRRPDDGSVIDLESLPGIDLTGSVARFTKLHAEETRP